MSGHDVDFLAVLEDRLYDLSPAADYPFSWEAKSVPWRSGAVLSGGLICPFLFFGEYPLRLWLRIQSLESVSRPDVCALFAVLDDARDAALDQGSKRFRLSPYSWRAAAGQIVANSRNEEKPESAK